MKHIFRVLVAILFISCSSDDSETITPIDYRAENEQEILEFIDVNNLDAQKSATGLYYVIDEAGAGSQPTTTSNVTVAYKGYFTGGTVFDQSTTDGITIGLQQVIKGWTEGIPYFKAGGSGILLIPSHLGYGNNGRQGIPGGSVLIFDIKLISVN